MLTVSVFFTAAASTSNRPIFFSDFQHINSLHPQLTVSVPIIVGASLHSNSTQQPLDQPTRLEIYSFIKNNPGVHFRGICNGLGLSVGVLQYHLSVLEKAGLITVYSDGQNKRYFNNAYTQTDMKLISLVRHETAAKILTILAQNGSAFHKEIARSLGVSSQALSWQINQLEKAGLLNAEKTGINVKYSLNNIAEIKCILNLTNNLKNN